MDSIRSAWGTTRGCPYHCNWCAKPIYGQRYNSRSPENVVEEIQQIKEQVEPDHIWICDDIFGLKRGWIERFSQLVCERGLQIPFKCLQRTDLVNPKIARCLRDAGCESVWMGAESGSQRILDAMEKGATVQDTYRATRDLREVGIRVGYFLQFGYPGEEWEDILQTFRMVRDCMPDDIGISVSYPLPGTPFYQRVVSQLGPQKNWQDSRDMAMLFRGRFRARLLSRASPGPSQGVSSTQELAAAQSRRLAWAARPGPRPESSGGSTPAAPPERQGR